MEKWKAWWAKWPGISGSTFKMIAAIAMLIDHIGAGILWQYLLLERQGAVCPSLPGLQQALLPFGGIYTTYRICRKIGRVAFPIYCFFLVEGMTKTRHEGKYLGRLMALALCSEIPYDLYFNGSILEFTRQNVYFTLGIGLGMMIGMKKIQEKVTARELSFALQLLVFLGASCLADWIRCDYGSYGILSIGILYLLFFSVPGRLLGGAISFCWGTEYPVAPLTFVALALYKGKRGKSRKVFFYSFYPLHLVLLYLLGILLGVL